MTNNFYTYLLKRPDGIPFYVGKGRGRRCSNHLKPWHLKHDPNRLKVNIINKIRRNGDEPSVEIIKKNLTESDAFLLEIELIKQYGRIKKGGILSNMSDGGEGQYGYRHTEKLKKEFSKRFSGENNPFYGKKHSDATLKLVGDTNRGKTLNNEWRKKLSVATKGRRKSDDHKRKIQIALQKYQKTPKEIQRLIELNKSRRGIPVPDERKKRISIALKGIPKGPMSEEIKNKIRQTRLERYGKHK